MNLFESESNDTSQRRSTDAFDCLAKVLILIDRHCGCNLAQHRGGFYGGMSLCCFIGGRSVPSEGMSQN